MENRERNQKQNYQLLKKIGSGSYGKVFKAQTKSDKRVVAVKVIDIRNRNKTDIEQVLNEIRILFSINSPYIIDYYTAFVNESSTEFWIVMEYMPGGDLQKRIQQAKKQRQKISEKEIWKFFVQILAGIKDLNLKNIIHRDIKPANIFLSKDFQLCKIGDMNVSKVIKNQLAETQIGTPYYLPPEIWKNESYDIKCDIFSLGCLIYELATLRHPFEATSTNELQKKVLKRKTPDLPVYYSQELNLIVKKCLSKTPSNRPTAEELYENSLFRKKVMEYGHGNFLDDNAEICFAEVLETIVIPKKLSDLNSLLPKKNLHQKSNSVVVLSNMQEQKYVENLSSLQPQQEEIEVQQITKQNSVVCLEQSIPSQKPLIPQQYDNQIDIMRKNQSEIIKKYQREQNQASKKNLPKKLSSAYSNKNIPPQPQMNFNKKRKPSQNFINKNRNSVKKMSRKSSYSRYHDSQIQKQQQEQKRLSSVKKRQSSRQNSIKKVSQNSRQNSIKRESQNIRQNSMKKEKTNRQDSHRKSISRNEVNRDNYVSQNSNVPPPLVKRPSSKHKRLASLEGYYSNKQVQKQQKQSYASYKNPPIRSQKQVVGRVPPVQKKTRLRSKSQHSINKINTTQEKKKKQKAIKYGDYMKKVAQDQREKLKSRRSISKQKRQSSANINRKI